VDKVAGIRITFLFFIAIPQENRIQKLAALAGEQGINGHRTWAAIDDLDGVPAGSKPAYFTYHLLGLAPARGG
jgi:hypothetical protein